jgi:hypothetical protein
LNELIKGPVTLPQQLIDIVADKQVLGIASTDRFNESICTYHQLLELGEQLSIDGGFELIRENWIMPLSADITCDEIIKRRRHSTLLYHFKIITNKKGIYKDDLGRYLESSKPPGVKMREIRSVYLTDCHGDIVKGDPYIPMDSDDFSITIPTSGTFNLEQLCAVIDQSHPKLPDGYILTNTEISILRGLSHVKNWKMTPGFSSRHSPLRCIKNF